MEKFASLLADKFAGVNVELDYLKYDVDEIFRFKEFINEEMDNYIRQSKLSQLDTVVLLEDFILKPEWTLILDEIKANVFNTTSKDKNIPLYRGYHITGIGTGDGWYISDDESNEVDICHLCNSIEPAKRPPANIMTIFINNLLSAINLDDKFGSVDRSGWFIKSGRWHPSLRSEFDVEKDEIPDNTWVYKYASIIHEWDIYNLKESVAKCIAQDESRKLRDKLVSKYGMKNLFNNNSFLYHIFEDIKKCLYDDQSNPIEEIISKHTEISRIFCILDILDTLFIAPIYTIIMDYYIYVNHRDDMCVIS